MGLLSILVWDPSPDVMMAPLGRRGRWKRLLRGISVWELKMKSDVCDAAAREAEGRKGGAWIAYVHLCYWCVCQRNFLTGLRHVEGRAVVYGFRLEQSNTWPSIWCFSTAYECEAGNAGRLTGLWCVRGCAGVNGSAWDWSSRPRCLRSDISPDTPGPGNTLRSDDCDSPPDLQQEKEGKGEETERERRRERESKWAEKNREGGRKVREQEEKGGDAEKAGELSQQTETERKRETKTSERKYHLIYIQI